MAPHAKGFTLIEVLVALAIVAIVLTPLFIMEGNTLNSLGRLVARSARIMAAREFLADQLLAATTQETPARTAQRAVANPPTQLRYELADPSSAALKKYKGLKRARVTAQWTSKGRQQQEGVVTFIYQPSDDGKAS